MAIMNPPTADIHGREYARDGTSPTFVAQFADGITTRMTCHCTSDHLVDLARGMKLSRAAYESRIRKLPPAIIKARFVRPFSDETIKSYDRTELDEIEQRARAIADEAAKQMRKQLETSTPADLGYPDMSAEELVGAERF